MAALPGAGAPCAKLYGCRRDGRVLTIEFHQLKDKKEAHDYAVSKARTYRPANVNRQGFGLAMSNGENLVIYSSRYALLGRRADARMAGIAVATSATVSRMPSAAETEAGSSGSIWKRSFLNVFSSEPDHRHAN